MHTHAHLSLTLLIQLLHLLKAVPWIVSLLCLHPLQRRSANYSSSLRRCHCLRSYIAYDVMLISMRSRTRKRTMRAESPTMMRVHWCHVCLGRSMRRCESAVGRRRMGTGEKGRDGWCYEGWHTVNIQFSSLFRLLTVACVCIHTRMMQMEIKRMRFHADLTTYDDWLSRSCSTSRTHQEGPPT